MAKRTSKHQLTANELIIQKLKETFNQNGNILEEPNNTNLWLMSVTAIPFDPHIHTLPFQTTDERIPTHYTRVILRTSDAQTGSNPYVDGSEFFLTVDESNQTADFVGEEESFDEAPQFHGGDLPSALSWLKTLSESLLYLTIQDPFLTAAQRFSLNGHEDDYISPGSSNQSTPRSFELDNNDDWN
ncbi:hypothetical protein NSS98_30785 [Paenibacillus sp. FSL E2-0274]|uniref:hypothetical protein n=1 Tax=Paenibacillus TaxID=44249 RepID=UPI00096E3D62|nr:hypothetical protein [Paenibacillus odorifer]OMD12606.1 hypothetical protein BJP47_05140 [Paenibacillus odorifer]OME36246.1 hypothetical protein BSK63_03855 [Paenibacillus odorifer]